MEQFINYDPQTLGAAITSTGATSITLSSVTGLPSSGTCRILVDNEYMIVSLNGTTTVTVTRGAEGSTAATHANGAAVAFVLTAGALLQSRSDSQRVVATSLRGAAGVIGNIMRASDSDIISYDNGTQFQLYPGNLIECLPPDLSTFTAYGGASGSAYSTAAIGDTSLLYLNSGISGSTAYAGALAKALTPSVSWQATLGFHANVGLFDQLQMGIAIYESSSGKCITAGPYWDNVDTPAKSEYMVLNMTYSGTGSSFGATITEVNFFPVERIRYIRLYYDNVNAYVVVSTSPDGLVWTYFGEIAFSNFTSAPDHVGFGMVPFTSLWHATSMKAGIRVFHWEYLTGI